MLYDVYYEQGSAQSLPATRLKISKEVHATASQRLLKLGWAEDVRNQRCAKAVSGEWS